MAQADTHPWLDPSVEEVRAARDIIAARHDYDVEKLAAAFAERSKASGRRTASPLTLCGERRCEFRRASAASRLARDDTHLAIRDGRVCVPFRLKQRHPEIVRRALPPATLLPGQHPARSEPRGTDCGGGLSLHRHGSAVRA